MEPSKPIAELHKFSVDDIAISDESNEEMDSESEEEKEGKGHWTDLLKKEMRNKSQRTFKEYKREITSFYRHFSQHNKSKTVHFINIKQYVKDI